MAIALVTLVTLCSPTSRSAELLEHRFATWVIWVGIWTISLVPASIGTAIWDQSDLGGVCWYKAGSWQNSLMLFIPRGIALVLVIGIC